VTKVDERLHSFFNPRSIAVIGASNNPSKLGYSVFENLKKYDGEVYPVNIREDMVQGVKVHGGSVLDIPGDVDLAVVITRAETVPKVLEDCGQKGVKAGIIITAGFSEVGNFDLEKKVLEIARRYGVRLIGPNSVGIMNTQANLNATFVVSARPGKIAFISQSGALGGAIIYKSLKEKIGFSKFVSLGNMADVDFAEILEYFAEDEETNSVALYMEGVKNGRTFMEAAKKTSRLKPVITLKAGKSEASAKAIASHTGSLSGSYAMYRAAFKQTGILTAEGIGELLSMAKSFDQPLPNGNRVAIMTNAGGPGVLVTDALESYGLKLAELQSRTVRRLKEILPPIAVVGNPVDMLASGRGEHYEEVAKALLEDENVDLLITVCVVPTFAGMSPTEHAEGLIRAVESQKKNKPVLALFMAGDVSSKAKDLLDENKIPTYEDPKEVASAAYALYAYQKFRSRLLGL